MKDNLDVWIGPIAGEKLFGEEMSEWDGNVKGRTGRRVGTSTRAASEFSADVREIDIIRSNNLLWRKVRRGNWRENRLENGVFIFSGNNQEKRYIAENELNLFQLILFL